MHVAYEKQLEWKRKKVEDCIPRIGGLTEVEVLPVLGNDTPWHYRNKAQYPVGVDAQGNLIAGFYAGHSHHIVEEEHCLIQDERSNEVLSRMLAWMRENHISAYDETTGKGLVRHVVVRVGKATGQIMAGRNDIDLSEHEP